MVLNVEFGSMGFQIYENGALAMTGSVLEKLLKKQEQLEARIKSFKAKDANQLLDFACSSPCLAAKVVGKSWFKNWMSSYKESKIGCYLD